MWRADLYFFVTFMGLDMGAGPKPMKSSLELAAAMYGIVFCPIAPRKYIFGAEGHAATFRKKPRWDHGLPLMHLVHISS